MQTKTTRRHAKRCSLMWDVSTLNMCFTGSETGQWKRDTERILSLSTRYGCGLRFEWLPASFRPFLSKQRESRLLTLSFKPLSLKFLFHVISLLLEHGSRLTSSSHGRYSYPDLGLPRFSSTCTESRMDSDVNIIFLGTVMTTAWS
jgi:hypothetical protein